MEVVKNKGGRPRIAKWICPGCGKPMPVTHFACGMGRKGGAGARGAKKVCGPPEFYKAISMIARCKKRGDQEGMAYWRQIAVFTATKKRKVN